MKARLDIKVAIYKEPGERASGARIQAHRAPHVSPIIRISIHIYVHTYMHTHTHTYVPVDTEEARERGHAEGPVGRICI